MKPTITTERPSPPIIKLNEGAHANPIQRYNPYLAQQRQQGTGVGTAIVGAASGLVGGLFGALMGRPNNQTTNNDNRVSNRTDVRNDNRQDNRQYADHRTTNNNRHYSDNRSLTNVDHDSLTVVDHDETNTTVVNDLSSQSYSVQNYSNQSYTDASITSVAIDNSQHYTDNSTHTTNVHNDNSHHHTDNSRHLTVANATAGQSLILGIFFGDGLEKVLMALVMLSILVTIFLTELLMIAGGLAAFVVVYKIAKFAWQRSEADKTRKHQLELARLGQPVVMHYHFHGDTEKAAEVVERISKPKPVKQPQALPEPAYFEADKPSAVGPTKTERVKSAAKKHAKRQANLFIDGMKHEVIGMKRKGK